MSATRSSAPLGIKVICLLGGFGALLGILGGIGITALGGVGVLLGPIVLVLSVAQLAAVYGLWTLQPWGWTLAVAIYGLDVLLDLSRLLFGELEAILGLVVSALILAYIVSKRDHYRSGERKVPRANRV